MDYNNFGYKKDGGFSEKKLGGFLKKYESTHFDCKMVVFEYEIFHYAQFFEKTGCF